VFISSIISMGRMGSDKLIEVALANFWTCVFQA